jgi:NTE family protein
VAKRKPKPINLALQGGGAHGAFTWGVLDRLLEGGEVDIRAISGTSAGAMNAAVLADGLEEGGPEGARAALQRFWSAISLAARASPIRRGPIDVFMGNWNLDYNPSTLLVDILQLVSSPYDFNPWKINPLKLILEREVDFKRVRKCEGVKLFISATNVQTGRVKVFEHKKLNVEMVMASAALPFIYQAVMIDGEPYWDGGYMGNPALFPLYGADESDDIVIVQVNPIYREGVPRTARDIINRVNEISFNSSLLAEFRAINFMHKLIERGGKEKGVLEEKKHHKIHVHMIDAQEMLRPLGASSKVNAEWEFLDFLFNIGREAGDAWIKRHWADLGERTTIELMGTFAEADEATFSRA